MKKLILAGLLSVGVACACDTENCQAFIQASNDFKKVYNIKKLDRQNIKDSLEKSAMVMGVTDSFCNSYAGLSVNEIVSLQTKNPQFANINDDMSEQCKDWHTGQTARAMVKGMYIFMDAMSK